MNILKPISNFKVSRDLSYEERSVMRVANIWALYAALTTVPFILISQSIYPPILPFTSILFLCFSSHFLLNAIGMDNIMSRALMAIGAPAIIGACHMLIRQATDPLIPGVSALQATMCVMPWVLFTAQEKGWRHASMTLNFLVFFLPAVVTGWADGAYASAPFYDKFITILLYLTSILFLWLFYSFYKSNYNQLQKEKNDLVGGLEEKQAYLTQQSSDLKSYVKKVEEQNKENEQRQEIMKALNELNKLLQDDQWEETRDQFLSSLIQFTEANQGGIYSVDRKREELTLSAKYAYNRKKHEEQAIPFGEGLVGQAVLEKDTKLFTDIPANFITIGSGLGDSKPRSVLIVPVVHKGLVRAVIEIASFKVFQEHHIELAKQAGEVLASFLTGHVVGMEMKALVAEAERAKEHMREQEDMMRENMEEIMIAQEEMRRELEICKRELAEAKA